MSYKNLICILISELLRRTQILNYRGLEREQLVLLTHGDSIDRVAESFRVTAKSSNFVTGIASDKMNLYGVQFHPEVDLTPNGKTMLQNFLFDIAGLTGNYTLHSRESQCIQYIRETIGNKKVLVRDTHMQRFVCRM